MLDVGETIENIATIDSPDKLTDLYKLITNPSRQLPVIVISENTSLDNISAKYFAVMIVIYWMAHVLQKT